ncbi:MAG: hypothetical protein ACYSWP_19565 [Planctomycetota bacterium]|jgi:ribonuclease Z
MKNIVKISSVVLVLVGIVIGLVVSQSGIRLVQEAEARGGKVKSPTGSAPERYVYYPGTEELAPDEIRVIACGTGMPAARKGQAATSFLVELGNGDKFLFDIHWGDLATLWAGGWTAGRTSSLKVWGPSGKTKDMGTEYALEHFLKAYNWDYQTRVTALPNISGQIETVEFDYKGLNEIVYQENGVTIRSFPAIHSGDGSVSYSLEWNDYKFVFGGDSYPNKWFIKYAKDADLAIHECMMLPEGGVEFYNQPPPVALFVFTQIHTSPQAFGKIMSTIKPKHAVAYHFFNEEATRYGVYEGVRETYDGPLSLATDLMVWNITRSGVKERMAVVTEEAWSVPSDAKPMPNEKGEDSSIHYTDFILNGKWDVSDAEGQMIKAYMKKYKLDPAMFAPKKK